MSGHAANRMLTPTAEGFRYAFGAMASPCEVLLDTHDRAQARRLGRVAEAEAARVEWKYSRYRADSVVSAINTAGGRRTTVDEETAALLDYAAQCFDLSDGLFDITSGVLRRIWRFDGSDAVPTRGQVEVLLPLVGWEKVGWDPPHITLPPGMEIDFGGIGKEYAVDRALLDLMRESEVPMLVNFGGDLRVSGRRADGGAWRIALEAPDRRLGTDGVFELSQGALTTSGDARRFLLKDGKRYSHILDPRTGWPVESPPRSVTVAAPTCMEAGILSTLAMLKGRGAEAMLREEGVRGWCIR